MADQPQEFFARCASGFEQVLATELRGLRAKRVRPLHGGVAFFGTTECAYRVCLWSRVATRVQLVLARIQATDAQTLYDGVCGIAWERHVRRGATVAVRAHGTNDNLRNTAFTALKVKDALCDYLRKKHGSRPNVDAKHPDFEVDVALHQQKATLYLNLSGESLHRRGYREDGVQTEAPLKETLAAGLLLFSGWPSIAREGGVLVDPMCGSGTIAIEAAMMAAHVAPGLLRTHWGFEGWSQHDAASWELALAEAHAAMGDVDVPHRQIAVAGDINAQAVQIARDNARRAGVDNLVRFYVGNAAQAARHFKGLDRGERHPWLLVTNPPYGERLLAKRDLPMAYEALATAVNALPAHSRAAVITPDAGIDSSLGRLPHAQLDCFNGPIATSIRVYDVDDPSATCEVVSLGGTQHTVPIADKNSVQFAARLRKVAKERARWARKEDIWCYRVYDADLPDYAFSVDVYGDEAGERHVVLEEARRPAKVNPNRAAHRLADARAIVCATLDVPAREAIVRPWQDKRARHDRGSEESLPITVHEGGLTFAIDLAASHRDLPLEQRGVRQLVGTLAKGQKVACLFATGGAALAYAAHGGATATVAVDASKGRLASVRHTLQTNGLARTYREACMDVRTWLAKEAKAHRKYGLIICVPPTWLPAKDAGGREWDLVRQGQELVRAAARVLERDGSMVLAHSDASIMLRAQDLASPGLVIEDASARTQSHDFARSPHTSTCLVVRHR
ncbi:MAG: bifunctional 23S rRNA (guanine(2069)-N(7))-methyltransferase RlmK/23S rRNA (guanine(2445)-N(2))-methyltransferase RlmL [Atopobiaceae bacterium]|nr:bifunctional 23S rRNA (guanine(2069)-N(7))-methyltransferase RlmK/23S rRNA (guanine(2445)-N(2))-methyltransferase RlmL [Atopobiaceae bacterium]